jgi:hypothetical protein
MRTAAAFPRPNHRAGDGMTAVAIPGAPGLHPPDLGPEDLEACRAAWARLRNERPQAAGEPDYLAHPAVLVVARYALACALEHGEPAGPRPLSVFESIADTRARMGRRARAKAVTWRRESTGRAQSWDVSELAAWCERQSRTPAPKGESAFLAPGATANGLRRDATCSAVGWVAVDCDDCGTWDALRAESAGLAAVFYTSPSGRPTKWRAWIPLRTPWTPAPDAHAKKAYTRPWKKERYPAARFVLGALARLRGAGFDPSTSDLLNRFYPPVPVPPPPGQSPAPMTVLHQVGVALDLEALWSALEGLGITAEAAKAPRRPGARKAREWIPVEAPRGSEAPLVQALRAAHWLGAPVETSSGPGWVAWCPWASLHSTNTDGTTATVAWADGGWNCKHAHCAGRTARDVLDMLPPDARAVFDAADAAPRAVRAVLARVPDAPARVSVDHAKAIVREAVGTAKAGEAVLVAVSPGAGKSFAMMDEAAARAARGERTVILAGNRAAVTDIRAGLLARGVASRAALGIDAFKTPDGAPVCRRLDEVNALQSWGVPARSALCRGRWRGQRLGPACEHVEGCAAASPFTGADGAHVLVATHAMAPLALAPEGPDAEAAVYVDELPSELTRSIEATPKDLRQATRAGDVRGDLRRAALDLACGGLAHAIEIEGGTPGPVDGVDLVGGLAGYVETPDGAEAWRVWLACSGKPPAPAPVTRAAAEALLESVAAALAHPDPALPREGTLVQLRTHAKGAAKAGEGRWTLYAAVRALVTAQRAAVRLEGGSLRISWRTAVADALAGHRGPLVVLDGTADAEAFGRVLGRPVRPVAAVVRERAVVHRRIIATPDANISRWCPWRRVAWDSGLAGALRSVVREVVEHVPAGAAVALATFTPIAKALAETWSTGRGPGADLLAPLREHGVDLVVTHFGSTLTRGTNALAHCAATVSLGDPRPNVGAARAVAAVEGADEGEAANVAAAAALGQWHERLRGVQRDAELWAWHVGALVPAGQWDADAVTVTAPALGRPSAGCDVRAAAGQLVDLVGSEAGAARAAGVGRVTLRRARGEMVSASVAGRIRAAVAAVGPVSKKPLLRMERERMSADFSIQRERNSSEALQNVSPLPVRTHPAPVQPALARALGAALRIALDARRTAGALADLVALDPLADGEAYDQAADVVRAARAVPAVQAVATALLSREPDGPGRRLREAWLTPPTAARAAGGEAVG